MGDSFIQLSGEDATALGYNAQGGHGCISVVANVAPRLLVNFNLRFHINGNGLSDRIAPLIGMEWGF